MLLSALSATTYCLVFENKRRPIMTKETANRKQTETTQTEKDIRGISLALLEYSPTSRQEATKMPCGNPSIEQYEKRIINEASQGKKVIVIRGVRYYRTNQYIRKTDGAKVIAYYNHDDKEGFRVEFTELGAKVVVMESRKERKKATATTARHTVPTARATPKRTHEGSTNSTQLPTHY